MTMATVSGGRSPALASAASSSIDAYIVPSPPRRMWAPDSAAVTRPGPKLSCARAAAVPPQLAPTGGLGAGPAAGRAEIRAAVAARAPAAARMDTVLDVMAGANARPGQRIWRHGAV